MSDYVEGVCLKVLVGEADTVAGEPLYLALIEAAKKEGAHGAMVIRGVESFGQTGAIHTARLLRLSEDLPLVIEVVDTEETIARFAVAVDRIMDAARCGGVVVEEPVRFKRYDAEKR
jgi:PII-like signaling protein